MVQICYTILSFWGFACGIFRETCKTSHVINGTQAEVRHTLLPRIHVHALIYETAHFVEWSGGFAYKCMHKLCGYKCMHQYTKQLYVKLSSNIEFFKFKIDTQALYDNSKRCSTQWDYIKTFSHVFKTNWAMK